MFLKKNYIMNEGYEKPKDSFHFGKGSKIFIKKKQFLDLSLCAGSLILGHNSNIFKQSIKDALDLNISNFAAKNIHAQNFSNTLKKIFPKYSKFIFCNSGTEAVIKSLRIARSLSKKKMIISVTGSWHGSTSELLYSTDSKFKVKPLSDGLADEGKRNLKFIPYNDIQTSKKILEKNKKKIMCIIIEPVQGCLPQNAKKYLRFLDQYSRKNNIILIFDEMISGLRFDGSCVQDNLKLNPSITTFGKCLGGGLPIGIIAIKKNIELNIRKKKLKIFFGGTFSGNPINTFVGNKISKYIIHNKKMIFSDLERKSKYLNEELNNFFKINNFQAKCLRVSSMLRIVFTKENAINRFQRDFFEKKNTSKINQFRKFLFTKKIYYPTSGIIFLGTSTNKKDLDYLIKIIKLAFLKIFKKH